MWSIETFTDFYKISYLILCRKNIVLVWSMVFATILDCTVIWLIVGLRSVYLPPFSPEREEEKILPCIFLNRNPSSTGRLKSCFSILYSIHHVVCIDLSARGIMYLAADKGFSSNLWNVHGSINMGVYLPTRRFRVQIMGVSTAGPWPNRYDL